MAEGAGSFHFDLITPEEARAVAEWRYEGELAVYNCPPDEVDEAVLVMLLAGNQYYAVHDDAGGLVGYCCFGEDARVSGGDYSDASAIDVGLGLRPDLVGRGLGTGFVEAIMRFAGEQLGHRHLRLTVAAWNRRAIRTYEKAGFTQTHTFTSRSRSGAQSEWVQMTRSTKAARDDNGGVARGAWKNA